MKKQIKELEKYNGYATKASLATENCDLLIQKYLMSEENDGNLYIFKDNHS